MKPPEQAPLSSLRLAELIDGILPPGVWNVVPGGREVGQVLASHPDVAKVALIGSVPTGRAVMKAAADTLKPVLLELGGKNALIAFPDADLEGVSAAVVDGMNFTWCGQSCGSTSRAFVHEKIYDAGARARCGSRSSATSPAFRPIPRPPWARSSAKVQYDRVLGYIEAGKEEGARLIAGGKRPDDPRSPRASSSSRPSSPTSPWTCASAGRKSSGPCCRSSNGTTRPTMLEQVNAVEYGLTCVDLDQRSRHRASRRRRRSRPAIVWINEVSKHFLGAPFGGYKQSGIGREECIEELLGFTREKNIHVRLNGNPEFHCFGFLSRPEIAPNTLLPRCVRLENEPTRNFCSSIAGRRMKRREFMTLIGGAAAAYPARRPRARVAMPVIGFLDSGSPAGMTENLAAFHRGLGETGFVEGQNLAIEYRWAQGRYDRFLPALAAELVRRPVAAIAATRSPGPGLAAKAATSTIPIVFQSGSNPVQDGLVASLNRPGGNVTGVTRLSTALISRSALG